MYAIPSLLMIALIIIVVNHNSKLFFSLKKLEDRLKQLQSRVTELSDRDKPAVESAKPETKQAPAEYQKKPAPPEAGPYVSIFDRVEEPAAAGKSPVSEEEPAIIPGEPRSKTMPAENIYPRAAKEKISEPVPAPSFFERHPDMEKFIGENLISKIGIAVLVLAIGFFVKYAIDNDWVGPVGRVAIGVMCGGILTVLAHRLRNSYRAFSSVLAGGGIAVFYFTITLAYTKFHLFEQPAAFVIMIVITAFAVALSLLYDKQELAVIALVGGFSAPFLVSNGSGNYVVLFTYLIILNSGLLVIAYRKSWRLLNLLSFLFTAFLFGGWLWSLPYDANLAVYKNGLIFAGIFYLLFFLINIAYNTREKKKFIASDFSILLANTGLYFGAGLYCLNMMHATDYNGLFSAAMGVFNLCASYFLFRKNKVDTNILYLLIGLTLTFISVTAPLQLHGHFITLFWACETVLLFWLYTKSKIGLIKISSAAVWIMMMLSLLMDWAQIYNDTYDAINIIANKGFITGIFCAAASYLLFVLKNKDASLRYNLGFGKNLFRIAAILLLFITGALEINHQFSFYYPGTGIAMLYLLLYTTAFINSIFFINSRIAAIRLDAGILTAMLGFCLVLYIPAVAESYSIQDAMLTSGKNNMLFIAHWFIALLVAYDVIKIIAMLRREKIKMAGWYDSLTWVLCGFVVFFLSHEVLLITNAVFYSPQRPLAAIQEVYIKSGLPVLWGLCSFAFMWCGMHYKFRPLRIISLSLFLLTLIKLFFYDIRNVSAGGKIAAFFSLGVLLLVVSFMYQRLKKIIIDNEKKD